MGDIGNMGGNDWEGEIESRNMESGVGQGFEVDKGNEFRSK
jgi:hypothetical protein